MSASFFWYDLETSGFNPRSQRIMQFAGQRTDMDLQPIGEPVNVLIKLTEDVLPDPDAILVTGITPQHTLQDGMTEVEFMQLFASDIASPDTIFVGYNSVRFDDEFMRALHYRNFYDPYEWQWKEGRGRWDLLDVVRMTRALRPDGIKWPVDGKGKPTNRLELLTGLNGLDHENAHDALNDVQACIALAKLIQAKQPKLFAWLLNLREKAAIKKFLDENQTFIYSSGKYASEVEKTAVVRQLFHDNQGAVVYDLRFDPTEFKDLTPKQLVERWQWTKDKDAPPRLPVKTLKYNRCPALSPVGVLSDATVQQRLKITPEIMNKHAKLLAAMPELVENILKARNMMDKSRVDGYKKQDASVDDQIYDGFLDDHDSNLLNVVRAAEPDELAEVGEDFHDLRMKKLLPLYKARNFAASLTDEERVSWEKHRHQVFMDGGTNSRLSKFMHRLSELASSPQGSEKRYLLEELQLYAESIMPIVDEG